MSIKTFELAEIINKLTLYESRECDISVKTRYIMAINIIMNILMREKNSEHKNKSELVFTFDKTSIY